MTRACRLVWASTESTSRRVPKGSPSAIAVRRGRGRGGNSQCNLVDAGIQDRPGIQAGARAGRAIVVAPAPSSSSSSRSRRIATGTPQLTVDRGQRLERGVRAVIPQWSDGTSTWPLAGLVQQQVDLERGRFADRGGWLQPARCQATSGRKRVASFPGQRLTMASGSRSMSARRSPRLNQSVGRTLGQLTPRRHRGRPGGRGMSNMIRRGPRLVRRPRRCLVDG